MAFILHIETATKVCSVALSKEGQLVALKESSGDGYSHGEDLTLFIQHVLDDVQISSSELRAISISSGPGSYTGLRIGSAVAKGMCYGLDIPLIAIDSLRALAALGQNEFERRNLAPVIDARRMEVYNAIYTSELEQIKPISADVIDEQSYKEFEPLLVFGDGAEKLVASFAGRNVEFDLTIEASAKGQIELAYNAYKNKDFVDIAYWEPYYLKDFVAGVKKAKHEGTE